AALTVTVLAACASTPAAAAGSACAAPAYRVFDFWVGEWEVTSPDGRPAGRNQISIEQEGCLLVERWRSVRGDTGMSMNFYDPVADRWRQVWVSPGIEIDVSGGMVGGSMVLEGTILYLDESRARPFRGTWTPLQDGRVRQFLEEAGEDGSWQPWFEGLYRQADGGAVQP